MSTTAHILVVDDDARLRGLIKRYLVQHDLRVTEAQDAAQARKLIATLDFDLAIVDVMMPGEDGMSLTTDWAADKTVPVILLTARGDPGDRIAGLKAGADDYLAKPFEPEELLLRIQAVLRRVPSGPAPTVLMLGACEYHCDTHSLWREGAPVRLSPAETTLMKTLSAQPNTAMPRWRLAETLGEGGDRTVDVHVTRLRRKLEPDPKAPVYLRTERGVGYMLVPDA